MGGINDDRAASRAAVMAKGDNGNMEVSVQPCLDGALNARGAVVILDIFRAGNTAAALLAAGAPYVVPVQELNEARLLKEEHPDWLLVGERKGLKPDGFDMNNSPAEAERLDLAGRPAILTTSAGTRGLTASKNADILLMASLINASSVVRFLKTSYPDRITLVPIGLEGLEPAEEDDAAALYLTDLLLGRPADYKDAAKRMLSGGGADRLRSLGQWRDLAYCLRLDRLEIFPLASMLDDRLVLTAAG